MNDVIQKQQVITDRAQQQIAAARAEDGTLDRTIVKQVVTNFFDESMAVYNDMQSATNLLKSLGVDFSASSKKSVADIKKYLLAEAKKNFQLVLNSDEDLLEASKAMLIALDNPLGADLAARKLQKGIFKEAFLSLPKKKQQQFFAQLDSVNLLDEFIDLGKYGEGKVPFAALRGAVQWRAQNPVIPDEITITDVTETIAQPEEKPNFLTVVEVDDLLPLGEGAPLDTPGIMRERDGEEKEIKTQPRLDWVLSALKEDGFDLKDMILYREKMVEGYNPDRSHYRVLEAQKDDRHFQIAVSEVVGNSTYIIREPIDYTEGVVITVADLKKDPTVFQVQCYTPAQWTRQIRQYAYTPLEQLDVQLKTRIGWGDKKSAVEQSFGEFYLETFQLPKVHDTSIIEHGPLAGKTTFQRLYYALHAQSIAGLQHVRNLPQLRDHIFGPDCDVTVELQPQKPQRPPAQEREARDVFRTAVLAIRDSGKITYNLEVNSSFREGKVSDIESIIGKNIDISSLPEFLIAAGLAQKNGMNIVPASPIIIQQFARLLS